MRLEDLLVCDNRILHFAFHYSLEIAFLRGGSELRVAVSKKLLTVVYFFLLESSLSNLIAIVI